MIRQDNNRMYCDHCWILLPDRAEREEVVKDGKTLHFHPRCKPKWFLKKTNLPYPMDEFRLGNE